jgi:predicted permease
MQTLWQDLRYGVRTLLKQPGFSLIAITTLALGIGANTLIFTLVNAVLLRPLNFPAPERIVRVFETSRTWNESTISPPNFLDWQTQQTAFERLVAFQGATFDLAGQEGIEQIAGMRVSADFFALLGVNVARGRSFLPEDDKAGGSPVIVLSHRFWLARFGGDANAVGRTLTLGGRNYTIIGVLPADFEFISPQTELWAPLRLGDEGHRMRRTERYLQAVGRLRAGITLQQAQNEMDGLAARLAQQYPDANANSGVRLVPLQEHLFGKLRDSLLILLGAVAFVLLIACANLANLLLARAAARQKEFAVRASLGASGWRLARQLLTESTVLSLAGAAAGLLLARWGLDLLVALWQQSGSASALAITRLNRTGLDARVLGFTLLIALLTGIIFGLAPVWQATRVNLVESLKEARSHRFAAWSGRRTQSALVVIEVALTLVLLVGAGLMLNSLWRLGRVNPGFAAEHLLTMRVAAPAARIAGDRAESNRKTAAFFREVTERVRTVPGIVAADVINVVPLNIEGASTRFTIENRLPASPAEVPSVPYRVLGPDYFRTMSIPLLRGRAFNYADTSDAPGVVIINEALAKRFWPNEEPTGRRIRRGGLDSSGPWMTVVGVVGDVKSFGLDEAARPELYIPHAQFAWPEVTLVVRAATDPLNLVTALRAQILAVDRSTLVTNVRTMEEWLARSVAARRFNMQLLLGFAVLALILSGVGIYGVMAFVVTARTHEIGIRRALGAQPNDMLRLIVGQGIKLALGGMLLGLGGALALTRLLKNFLFGVSATDPLTFAVIALLLLCVALLACFVPARRATRVDPLVALRYE